MNQFWEVWPLILDFLIITKLFLRRLKLRILHEARCLLFLEFKKLLKAEIKGFKVTSENVSRVVFDDIVLFFLEDSGFLDDLKFDLILIYKMMVFECLTFWFEFKEDGARFLFSKIIYNLHIQELVVNIFHFLTLFQHVLFP